MVDHSVKDYVNVGFLCTCGSILYRSIDRNNYSINIYMCVCVCVCMLGLIPDMPVYRRGWLF